MAASLANLGYLEHYLDSLEILPSELQRNFSLMRDLDTRANDEMKTIDALSKEYLANINKLSADSKAENMRKINKLYKKAKDYADDKVQLAMQTYEMVDKHIRRLDADLARFESDLKAKALNLHSSDSEASSKKKGRKSAEKLEKKRGKKVQSSDDEVAKSNKKKLKAILPPPPPAAAAAIAAAAVVAAAAAVAAATASAAGTAATTTTTTPSIVTFTAHPSDVLDMPVDPNEPTYCFCHQVSYGEMIGCDNPDCPIEWFHFACVGLTMKPKGKWYCSKCTSDKKKKAKILD